MKSFPGRAKLVTRKEPVWKSLFDNSTAFWSIYRFLVIWHRIQSLFSDGAKITDGRNFYCDKSENGKGINTTEPFEGVAMLHPPPDDSNLLQGLLHLTGPLHLHGLMVFPPVSLPMPCRMMTILLVETS